MTRIAQRFRPPIPLVEGKFHPPAPRPGTIHRARLVGMLAAEPGPQVIAVIAPPGYGKTTLLAQWAADERRPLAWVTIDDLDNDPVYLLSYLIAACDRIVPVDRSIRSGFGAPRQRVLAAVVPRLTSELHGWPQPAVLVLDDVDRLVDETALDVLTAVIDHLPPGFRVAIAGRTEPNLPIARLRAQGRLLEIGQHHLSLDEVETGAVTAAMGCALSPDEARELAERSEGWATGVYLAIIARNRGDALPGPLGSVSGRDRFIDAYLRSEFEGDLADDDVTFLTRTAIFDTISPAIAEAVTGLPEAGMRLRSLARTHLLIQEVRAAGDEYRYHNLLRDFLLAELARREPGALARLHRAAAAYCAAAGDIDRAIEHAIAGGDVESAARMVAAAALPTFYGGHGRTLERWLHGFDDDAFVRYPSLAVIAGWIYLMSGRVEAADRMGDICEHSAYSGPPGLGGASFESERAMLAAIMARHGPSHVLAMAEIAVAQEPPDSLWRCNALWLLGSAHALLGDAAAADRAYAEAVAAGASAGASKMVALAGRASIAMARGDWEGAEEFAHLARADVETEYLNEILPSLFVYAVGARVAIHGGDIAAGRDDLVRAQLLRPLTSYVAPWYAVHVDLELARAYLAISDAAGARIVIREAEQIVRRRPDLGVLNTELAELRRRLVGASSVLMEASSLTTAELRLLPLLPTHLSFAEIGERLFVSRNTVKTQAMSIYAKLQATSRSEAVEAAIELGLLEPFYGLRLRRRPTPD